MHIQAVLGQSSRLQSRLCSVVVQRHYQTSSVLSAVDKGQLSKLRKKTGFSFVNCKNALVKFDNDLVKAEKWLQEQSQKEGWTKASKLQSRPMSHGLIGVIVENNSAAMVEINCETDFVARNNKFQKLVCLVTNSFLQHGHQASMPKILCNKDEISAVKTDGGKTLSDLVAMEIGNIRENMLLRRGVYVKADGGLKIASYVHSAGSNIPKEGACSLGKYGALLTLSQSSDASGLAPDVIGQQIGQHIVGMNPQSLGEADSKPAEDSDSETRLLQQEFLLDPSLTVAELLETNGTTVMDFTRFECGEVLEQSE